MARRKGVVTVSTNYEVKIKAPFDARQLCDIKEDLTSPNSWAYSSTYAGMLVSVANDPIAENNGVYFLKVDEPTVESSWIKLFDENEFEKFQEQLEQDLSNYVTQEQVSGFAKISVGELPEVGDEQTIYFRLLDGNWEEYIYHNNNFVLIGSNAGDLSNYYTKSEVDNLIDGIRAQIPTSLAQLSNDATGFITASVDNLVNYYTKTETYTQEEVNALIGQLSTISFEVVDVLPQTGEANKIYLVPSTEGQPQNGYDEYIYVNESWEKIGSTDIDLSQYATKEYVNQQISTTVTGFATEEFVISSISSATQDMATNASVAAQLTQALQSYVTSETFTSAIAGKQDVLVSGTNIKTINGQSILGEGNIEIQGGGTGTLQPATDTTLGGILATDSGENPDVSAYVDVEEDGKAFVKIPSVDETSTADDVVNLLNTGAETLVLNGNA